MQPSTSTSTPQSLALPSTTSQALAPTSTSQDPLDSIQLTAISSPTDTATIAKPDNNFLQPGITYLPTSCSEVVFQVSTAMVVHYDIYYAPTPLPSFQPSYRSLGDGTLIATPFDEDLRSSHLSLLIIGSLFTIFVRNVFVSYGYVKRGRVKKKTLFYVLLASQVLAPVSLFPVILSYFVEKVNCTAIVHTSYLSAMISLGFLITGILGIKAYKCLENPKILLLLLGLLQSGATAFVLLDVIMTRGARRLTGSCVQASALKFSRYFVAVQFAQSLLICLCFVYASYKSRNSPMARGRMSVRLSMDDLPIQMPPDDDNPQGRGWWDHVPEPTSFLQRNPYQNEKVEGSTFDKTAVMRLPSHLAQHLGSREQRQKTLETRRADLLDVPVDDRLRGRYSPALSQSSRLSRMFPRMNLFRKVLKDELLYTTFITSTCVVVAILAAVGLNFQTPLSVTGWITLNWAIISLLTVHSFSRVVHRREKEAWIQQAALRTNIRTTASGPYTSSRNHSRRGLQTRTPSSKSRSMPREYRGGDPNDPYSDVQPLDGEQREWQFGTIVPSPPPVPLLVRNASPDSMERQEAEFGEVPPLLHDVTSKSQTNSYPRRI
ncbi:hypothetical protein NMY22_g3146 [Coprinellus aureogranulatus]|nr:hypothetical protein NMY22_g3146 [Coprinellus aureogranulatus]